MYLRILQSILLIFTPLLIFAHEPGHGSSFRFIENKNQWNQNVKYRADIQSGALFLEKNCFTYHLIDGRFLELIHLPKVPVNLDTLKLRGQAYKVNFENSNPDVVLSADEAYSDYYNYYKGKDPSKWASNVKAFRIVNYQNLYNGIDLKIYSRGNSLKYDFTIFPNVDPSLIQLKYDGINKLSIDKGNLVLATSLGNVTEQKPFAYQMINGRMITISCNYVLDSNHVSFSFPSGYNRNYKLIIDPVLIFSTYSGSQVDNFGYTATPDSRGFLYSGSTAFGIGYPLTMGAYQVNFGGGYPSYLDGTDIGITKYDTTGTKRIYSTYLGGDDNEIPHSMIVDGNDDLYVYGTTGSDNFPTTANSYDNTFAGGTDIVLNGLGVEFDKGSDIFVAKLSNDGSALLGSTYLGGSENDGLNISGSLRYNYADEVRGEVDVDVDGNVYVVTSTLSPDFPIVGNSFQQSSGGGLDGCIIKLTNDLSSIEWSSYIGGESSDAAYSLAIDDSSDLYIAGGTRSLAFPTTSGGLYPTFQGLRADGFITHINKDGQSILESTYYGSAVYDQIYFVELDQFNNVHVFGQTSATGAAGARFIKNAAFSQPNSGQFISKITPALDTVIWSTVFGSGSGIPDISPTAFLVDLCSKIYLSGWGGTPENYSFLNSIFGGPVTPSPFNMLTTFGPNPPTDYYQSTTDLFDFYLFVMESDASAVNYASFFGGNLSPEHVDGGTSRFDRKGKIYQAMCAGCGGNSDMPVKPPYGSTELPDHNNSGECNLGVFKMDFRLPVVVSDFDASPGCMGDTIQFINKSQIKSATKFKWFFGDGTQSKVKDPIHVYTKGGLYKVMLVLQDNATCNLADTITKTLYISDIGNLKINATADQYTIYKGKSTVLHAIPNSGYNYLWSPSSSLNNATIPNPVAHPPVTTTYHLSVSDPLVPRCAVMDSVVINVIEIFCNEPHIFVPDAFSPNEDGVNDILYVRGNDIRELYFTVYNRWGEKVFETKDQSIGWNGIYKDMKADPGVFVYYLEVTCVDDQKFFKKGNVTLIR